MKSNRDSRQHSEVLH